jgi:hypothetical protein
LKHEVWPSETVLGKNLKKQGKWRLAATVGEAEGGRETLVTTDGASSSTLYTWREQRMCGFPLDEGVETTVNAVALDSLLEPYTLCSGALRRRRGGGRGYESSNARQTMPPFMCECVRGTEP